MPSIRLSNLWARFREGAPVGIFDPQGEVSAQIPHQAVAELSRRLAETSPEDPLVFGANVLLGELPDRFEGDDYTSLRQTMERVGILRASDFLKSPDIDSLSYNASNVDEIITGIRSRPGRAVSKLGGWSQVQVNPRYRLSRRIEKRWLERFEQSGRSTIPRAWVERVAHRFSRKMAAVLDPNQVSDPLIDAVVNKITEELVTLRAIYSGEQTPVIDSLDHISATDILAIREQYGGSIALWAVRYKDPWAQAAKMKRNRDAAHSVLLEAGYTSNAATLANHLLVLTARNEERAKEKAIHIAMGPTKADKVVQKREEVPQQARLPIMEERPRLWAQFQQLATNGIFTDTGKVRPTIATEEVLPLISYVERNRHTPSLRYGLLHLLRNYQDRFEEGDLSLILRAAEHAGLFSLTDPPSSEQRRATPRRVEKRAPEILQEGGVVWEQGEFRLEERRLTLSGDASTLIWEVEMEGEIQGSVWTKFVAACWRGRAETLRGKRVLIQFSGEGRVAGDQTRTLLATSASLPMKSEVIIHNHPSPLAGWLPPVTDSDREAAKALLNRVRDSRPVRGSKSLIALERTVATRISHLWMRFYALQPSPRLISEHWKIIRNRLGPKLARHIASNELPDSRIIALAEILYENLRAIQPILKRGPSIATRAVAALDRLSADQVQELFETCHFAVVSTALNYGKPMEVAKRGQPNLEAVSSHLRAKGRHSVSRVSEHSRVFLAPTPEEAIRRAEEEMVLVKRKDRGGFYYRVRGGRDSGGKSPLRRNNPEEGVTAVGLLSGADIVVGAQEVFRHLGGRTVALARDIRPVVGRGVVNTAVGGIPFAVGEYFSNWITGHPNPSFEEFALNYGSLALGGGTGRTLVDGTLRLMDGERFLATNPMVTEMSRSLPRALVRRTIPLFMALSLAELSKTGRVDVKGLPLAITNIMIASGITHGLGGMATRAALTKRIGQALKLIKIASIAGAPETVGVTLGGACLASVVEFTILKVLADWEEGWILENTEESLRAGLAEAIRINNALMERQRRGEKVSMRAIEKAEQKLFGAEMRLEGFLINEKSGGLRARWREEARRLNEEEIEDITRVLDGTWSRAEVHARYEEKRRELARRYAPQIAEIEGSDSSRPRANLRLDNPSGTVALWERVTRFLTPDRYETAWSLMKQRSRHVEALADSVTDLSNQLEAYHQRRNAFWRKEIMKVLARKGSGNFGAGGG